MAPETLLKDIYGEGFAVAYTSDRYAAFSQRLAKFALSLLATHGVAQGDMLDLACGAGAGTVVLASAGYHVTGVDGSATMLRYASQNASAAGLNIPLFLQDMRFLALPNQFDAVTCLFDALNYLLQEDELARVFAAVRRVLRPDGVLVFDMNSLHGLATRWGTRDQVFTAQPACVEATQYRFDPLTGINTATTTLFIRQEPSGLYQCFREVHRERGYSMATLQQLLEQAGFSVTSALGLADGLAGLRHGLQPIAPDSGRYMVVARRT